MIKWLTKKIHGSGIGNYPVFKQLYYLHNWLFLKFNSKVGVYKLFYKNLQFKLNPLQGGNMFKSIMIHGYYEKEISEYFIKNIKKGDIFLDIGANLGYYSLIASKRVGKKGKVIAFEPVSENFKLFKDNIKLNNVKNIKPLKYGLGNENKKFQISINPKNIGNDSIVLDHDSGEKEIIAIKRFDDLDLDIDKSKIRFIKVDIEGFEFEAIKGMEKLIDLNRDMKIIIEFSPEFYINFGKNYTDQFIKFLYNKGFRSYSFEDNLKAIDLNQYKNIKQINILLDRGKN